jgi:hypothetical protein
VCALCKTEFEVVKSLKKTGSTAKADLEGEAGRGSTGLSTLCLTLIRSKVSGSRLMKALVELLLLAGKAPLFSDVCSRSI